MKNLLSITLLVFGFGYGLPANSQDLGQFVHSNELLGKEIPQQIPLEPLAGFESGNLTITAEGAIRVAQAGNYLVSGTAHVGGTENGAVQLWLQQNGGDVTNSGVEQTITKNSVAVLLFQSVLKVAAGDTLSVAMTASDPQIGLVKRAANERAPAMVSMNLVVFPVNGAFSQLSATESQTNSTADQVVLDATDGVSGMENQNGKITFGQGGLHFLMAAAQTGARDPEASGIVKLWMRQNEINIDNVAVKQTVLAGSTAVTLLHQLGAYQVGDSVDFYVASRPPETALGIVARQPTHGPRIPSLIFSSFVLGNHPVVQVVEDRPKMASTETANTVAFHKDKVVAMGFGAPQDGQLVAEKSGTYFVMITGEVSSRGAGELQTWFQRNQKAIPQTLAIQTVPDGYITLLVNQALLTLEKGDVLEVMLQGVGNGDLGLIGEKANDSPGIPSFTLSLFGVDSTSTATP